MFPTRRPVGLLPEHLRLGVCLLHALPGAVGSLRTHRGDDHVVAHHRADATLTPCQLRSGLLEPVVPGVPHLLGVIDRVECTGGALDLGGGIFQRCHPAAGDERWFATVLDADTVTSIVAACPSEIAHADVSVRISADVELGACAVCVSSETHIGLRLDEVACRLHAECLVTELAVHVASH